MEMLLTGFVFGLLGSFHCVGMCGPIALSLPLRGHTLFEKLSSALFYNVGRVLMYSAMGVVFGLIGKGFNMLGFQQWMSVTMGALLIVSVLAPLAFKNINIGLLHAFAGVVRRALKKLFTNRSYKALFVIGLMNALLPCGMVYLAIAGAIVSGHAAYGGIYMALFGLGTLPMMFAVAMAGSAISVGVRRVFTQTIPYVVVVVGVIFVFRGLCLGIPYLSPSKAILEHTLQAQTENPVRSQQAGSHACCNKE